MTGLSLSDSDRLALAAAGVAEGPDGSLRSASGLIVSPGVAASLIARKDRSGGEQARPAMSTVSPDQFHRGYIAAGHVSDSPANGPRGVIPEPPEGGGRSSSPCTTPDPDDGDPDEVEKVAQGFRVVEPEAFHRGPLIADHAAPSPADAGDSNPVAPVTGSGTVYEHAAVTYGANVARERAQHVAAPHECVSPPAPVQWAPPADLGVRNVPVPASPGHLTGCAPGER